MCAHFVSMLVLVIFTECVSACVWLSSKLYYIQIVEFLKSFMSIEKFNSLLYNVLMIKLMFNDIYSSYNQYTKISHNFMNNVQA